MESNNFAEEVNNGAPLEEDQNEFIGYSAGSAGVRDETLLNNSAIIAQNAEELIDFAKYLKRRNT